MKTACMLLGLAGGAAAAAAPRDAAGLPEALSDKAWQEWKRAFGRTYRSPVEELTRRANWERHVQRAVASNAANPLAIFGTDEWSDLSDDEHPAYSARFTPPNISSFVVEPPEVNSLLTLDAIDWRAAGVVTGVKSQVGGTCWSFSATGNSEAAWALAGHGLVALSEEQLIECGGGGGPYGIPIRGDKYDGQITGEADYPVAQQPGTCHSTPRRAIIESVECLPNCEPNDDHCGGAPEAAVFEWLRRGPVSISVAAGAFAGYQGGILTGNCNVRDLNHAVLIVGSGQENGVPYWIMKNSWGTGFGEGGYWRMQYGVNCMGLVGGGACQAHAAAAEVVV